MCRIATKLCDGTTDQVGLDEIERIAISRICP